MFFLANPLPGGFFPPDPTYPVLGPLAISGLEGLLLGIVLWRWTKQFWPAVLMGFLINAATLTLFWASLRRGGLRWDYDFSMVIVGEVLVVFVEAFAIMWFVSRRMNREPSELWGKSFAFSLFLNAASLIASVTITTESING